MGILKRKLSLLQISVLKILLDLDSHSGDSRGHSIIHGHCKRRGRYKAVPANRALKCVNGNQKSGEYNFKLL